MRKILLKFVILVFLTCVAIYLLLWIWLRNGRNQEHLLQNRTQPEVAYKTSEKSSRVVLSFVVCDSRFNESLNVVKSVLLFSRVPIHLVIFTDDVLLSKFNETLSKWRQITNEQLGFELHRINFSGAHSDYWMNLFLKCAAQRLFFPKLITHIDSIIYVDTDTLFLGPIEELWDHFSRFNNSQISALAQENENEISWYPRFAKHPFYGKYGLNSGVMLMNLTRMREFGWVDYLTPIMQNWKLHIPWGDQDIINIIFHYHERAVYLLSCRYNYRPDHCMYGEGCLAATSRGIFLLHGSRANFHNDKQPAFQAIYQAIDEHEIGMDPSKTLIRKIDEYISRAASSNCGNMKDAFLRVPTETFDKIYAIPDR